MFKEILPNIVSPLIVEGTLRIGYAIFASATLSFLGLGLPPPSPDWGLQVSQNRNFIPFAPWTVAFPALAIASLVIGVNLVAEQLDRARQL
jgi:peptide/nickel transport system permease protein